MDKSQIGLHADVNNETQTEVGRGLFKELLQPAKTILLKAKKIKKDRAYLIEVNLVGTDEIIRLNKKYHRKNRATDVISLSYFEPSMKDSFAGEIFICLPFAKEQAWQIGQPLNEELRFLFVHGLLHLFGYDHKKPKDEAKMLSLTYRILGRI